MTEEAVTSPETAIDGQVATEPVAGTTEAAPEVQAGQATEPTTETIPEDTFFDPSTVPPELQPAYKLMQGSYTKKMQGLSQQAKDIQETKAMLDAYNRDPYGTLQQLAAQRGFQVVHPGQQPQPAGEQEEWQPQSWDEVLAKAEERAEARVLERMQPQLAQMRDLQAQSVESNLDQIDPTWRQYEDRMTELVGKHPSLANDIPMLYEMSVPKEVREAQATQKALAKLRAIEGNTQVSATTTQPRTTAPKPKVGNFDDAVAFARQELASGGR